MNLSEAISANLAAAVDEDQLCIWLISDVTGELQDVVTGLFVDFEVVACNSKFHSTTQRRDQLLQDFQG
eukprot:12357483-Prorocentrum_lima.AAC.1